LALGGWLVTYRNKCPAPGIEPRTLGVTADALRANIGSKSAISLQRGQLDPKFQVEGVASHQPFFSEN